MSKRTELPDRVTVALGTTVTTIGAISVMSGGAAWLSVRSQLAAEHIVIPTEAPVLPGRPVKGPVTAFAEATAIKHAALKLTDGRAYGDLAGGDPAASTARDASLLRASLYSSVLAFAMAGTQVASGATLIMVGNALRRLSRG